MAGRTKAQLGKRVVEGKRVFRVQLPRSSPAAIAASRPCAARCGSRAQPVACPHRVAQPESDYSVWRLQSDDQELRSGGWKRYLLIALTSLFYALGVERRVMS